MVQGKARWIVRQQRYFKQFEPRGTKREYVSGESHLYLGKRYRLKVHAVDGAAYVRLSGPYLNLYCNDASDDSGRQALLCRWYRNHAERVFGEVLVQVLRHKAFKHIKPPPLSIRTMKRRWGSCSALGTVSLNVALIRAPRRCIEYVVSHELCHLLIPDHSEAFWRLLRRVMPDWRARKELLEVALI